MTAFDSADGLALRRAVCAAPDDDLPRLVLADYLDEHGDAADADRAAFIRAQCEMSRVPWMSQSWRKLNSSAGALLEKHREAWPTTVARLGVMYPHWGRGFIETVHVHAKRFTAKSGRRLLEAEPVRAICLVAFIATRGLGVAELVADPVVSRLRELDFGPSGLNSRDSEAVAAAGRTTLLGLEALRHNWLSSGNPARGLPLILRSLPRLSALGTSVSCYGRNPPLAQAVAGASEDPVFARVAHLDLTGAGVAGAAVALARSPHLGGLKRLRLSNGEVTRAGVAALAGAALTALEVLDLSGNRSLTDADVRSLADAAFAPTLKVLVVRRCGVAKANGQRFAGLFPHAEVVVWRRYRDRLCELHRALRCAGGHTLATPRPGVPHAAPDARPHAAHARPAGRRRGADADPHPAEPRRPARWPGGRGHRGEGDLGRQGDGDCRL